MIGLRNPDKFKSISALAPLGHPTNWEVSRKAFTSYLGADEEAWAQYDPLLLTATVDPKKWDEILIDQGGQDKFFNGGMLQNDKFAEAGRKAGLNVNWRGPHEGYSHEYFFVSTFIPEHVAFHAERLRR